MVVICCSTFQYQGSVHIISAGAKLENGAVVVASLEKPTAPVADGKQKEDKEKSDTL